MLRKVGIVAALIGLLGLIITAIAMIAVPFIEKSLATSPGQAVEYLGRVLDSNTLLPVSGAKITLDLQEAPPIVYTDSEGVYRFKVAITSDLSGQIRVDAEGYQVYTRNITIYRDIRQLEDIRLTPSVGLTAPTATRVSDIPTSITPTRSPVSILLFDDFNDGIIDKSWETNCSDPHENGGYLRLALSENQSAEWVDCEFWKNIRLDLITKISLKVTLSEGTNEGWIGILSSCGSNELNFMMSSEWVGYSGKGVSRTVMENFNGIPVTRTLSMEWTGENVIFTVVESRITASVPCTAPPTSLEIGVGTNPGAYVQGSFDEVVVYGTPASAAPTYPNGYIRFDELTGGIVDSTMSMNFQVNTHLNAVCFNNNPANPNAGYSFVLRPRNVLPKTFDGVYAKVEIVTLQGSWASLGLAAVWGDNATGVKIGAYYVGPGPAANGVDGEISVVTTTFGAGGTETTEVFPIHPDLIAPFSLRMERSGAMVNLYYNESTSPFATRSLPSAEMYGTYAHVEGNVAANTDVSACWHDISVLYR